MTLADRIEQLDGPDRGIDAEIAVLIGWSNLTGKGEIFCFGNPPGRPLGGSTTRIPMFTASIDVAMTLAGPDDDPLDLMDIALASAREDRDGVYFLPLHICAAALRAKAKS